MMRKLSTHELAAQLGVSEQTIRYHARRDVFPYDETPGGHRRYDLEEVRAALRSHLGRASMLATDTAFPPRGSRLDLSVPSGHLTQTMAMQLQATASYDERRFEQPAERLERSQFMDVFAVPGSARYPQRSHAVGAGA
jgi:DNA-binding transcriptional MerR regulator